LTKGKIRCRITTPNPPKPLEKTEFVTYSCYISICFPILEKVSIHIIH
jgi:hypothetical protein